MCISFRRIVCHIAVGQNIILAKRSRKGLIGAAGRARADSNAVGPSGIPRKTVHATDF